MEGVSREIRLVARPTGFPDEELFEVAEAPIPDPADGQILIRNAYFSVDPYMRPRMNDVRSYVAPFTLGEAMTGGAVGRIVASRNEKLAEGDWVLHQLGWREWALSDGSGVRKVDPSLAPGVDRARRPRHAGVHRVLRPVPHRQPAARRHGLRLRRSRSGRERRRPDGEDRRLPRHRERGLAGEDRVDPRARLRRGVRLPRRAGRLGAPRARAGRHRRVLRQRRRRPPRGGDRRDAEPRPHRRLRLDLPLQRRGADIPGRATCSWS